MSMFVSLVTLLTIVSHPNIVMEETKQKVNLIDSSIILTIRCDKTNIKVGDEIPIVFTIKNERFVPFNYVVDISLKDTDRIVVSKYKLDVVDQNGKPIVDPQKNQGGAYSGPCSFQTLLPNQTFTKTLILNQWALLKKPGEYTVTGHYSLECQGTIIASPPIKIKILPRTDAEMATYIEHLKKQLANTARYGKREALVKKLLYTCDPRIAPILIDEIYKSTAGSFWVFEGFVCYLPKDKKTDLLLLDAVKKQGLRYSLLGTLEVRGINKKEIKSLIEISLSPEHPDAWESGAFAAQRYPDESFVPRLIAIATDPKTATRAAIQALAHNRTDASVAALKKLLKEPDSVKIDRESIRKITEDAIRSAYKYPRKDKSKQLRKDDFDEKYQTDKK